MMHGASPATSRNRRMVGGHRWGVFVERGSVIVLRATCRRSICLGPISVLRIIGFGSSARVIHIQTERVMG